MNKAPETVPLDRTFADPAADHHGAAAALDRHRAQLRSEQSPVFTNDAKDHPLTVETLCGAVKTVEAALPPQSHRSGQSHQSV